MTIVEVIEELENIEIDYRNACGQEGVDRIDEAVDIAIANLKSLCKRSEFGISAVTEYCDPKQRKGCKRVNCFINGGFCCRKRG